jgi:hypothetical protein
MASVGPATPALLISMSMRPWASVVASSAAAMEAASVTSTGQ